MRPTHVFLEISQFLKIIFAISQILHYKFTDGFSNWKKNPINLSQSNNQKSFKTCQINWKCLIETNLLTSYHQICHEVFTPHNDNDRKKIWYFICIWNKTWIMNISHSLCLFVSGNSELNQKLFKFSCFNERKWNCWSVGSVENKNVGMADPLFPGISFAQKTKINSNRF